MSIADKLATIAENEEKVYEAGKDSGIRAMWKVIQSNGTRTNYNYAFSYMNLTLETFKPLHDIKPIVASNIFYPLPPGYTEDNYGFKMKDIEEQNGIVFDFSKCTDFTRAFCSGLFEEFNIIDMSSMGKATQLMFYGGYDVPLKPTRIEKLVFAETTELNVNSFQFAGALQYIGFEGTIANTINFSWSPLVPESMKKAILCLKNYSGTDEEFTYTITFSDACWTALEADSTAPNGMTWTEYVDSLGWNT